MEKSSEHDSSVHGSVQLFLPTPAAIWRQGIPDSTMPYSRMRWNAYFAGSARAEVVAISTINCRILKFWFLKSLPNSSGVCSP